MRVGVIALALALGAGGIGIYTAYSRDLARAQQRLAMSRTAATPCGLIQYAVQGDGAPVLVIHGAGGGFDQGLTLGHGLVEHGQRVIAMSRFGYLRTPLPPDASAEAQADAHACLLDALNISRAAVLGASAGAPSALQFALRHPQRTRSLVLLVPATYVPRAGGAPSVQTPPGVRLLFDTALRSDFLLWAANRMARDTIIRTLLATPPELFRTADATERDRVAALQEAILPVSARRLGLLNDAVVTSSLERYPLERIATPTLIVSARDDAFGTYDGGRYTAQQIPEARFVGYETGGHLLVGHQRDIDLAVAAFLAP